MLLLNVMVGIDSMNVNMVLLVIIVDLYGLWLMVWIVVVFLLGMVVLILIWLKMGECFGNK